MKQNPQLDAVTAKVAEEKARGRYWQLIVWDRERLSVENKPIGDCIVTMYRNILPNKAWEYSISQMIATPYGDPVNTASKDPDHMIAHKALGEYGPNGMKYATADFLSDAFTLPAKK